MTSKERCIRGLSELQDSAISMMIGAGLSIPSGMPSWESLIEPYVKDLNLKNYTIPYERILQYALSSVPKYNAFLLDFKNKADRCEPKPLHRLIAKLNLPRIWTTNYDGLIEKAYKDELNEYQLVAENKDVIALDYSKPQIVKMHGSLTDEKRTDIVLLECEYENYIYNRRDIYHLLRNDIKTKSFIYLGFSFSDSNIRRIVSSAWNNDMHPTGKPSYLLTVPPTKKKVLYNCWKKDLERYNIEVVELNNYSEIDTFMYELLKSRLGKNIVLLGKRDDEKYNSLAMEIGYQLAAAGYKLQSGGGPNLSISMAEGVWKFLEEKKLPDNDRVRFYYRYNGGSTNPKRGHIYYYGNTREEVRMRMIGANSVCLLMGDEDASENGMQQEIDIAKTKGARIIPVGCTGDLSRKTWETNLLYFSPNGVFEDLKEDYSILNTSSSDKEIAQAVVRLADQLIIRNY